jgi:hypothetical protein
MADYIEREAALRFQDELEPVICKSVETGALFSATKDADLTSYLIALPAADVRPVVRGKWTLNKDGSGTCSVCGREQSECWDLDNWDNFCHFCGADMRGGGNNG